MKFYMAIMLFGTNLFASNSITINTISCEYGFMYNATVATSVESLKIKSFDVKKQLSTTIVIKDTKNLSELNDWIKISDSKGHTITYSLKCRKL